MKKYRAGIIFKSKYRKGSPNVALHPEIFETRELALAFAKKEIKRAKKTTPYSSYVSWKPAVFMEKARR